MRHSWLIFEQLSFQSNIYTGIVFPRFKYVIPKIYKCINDTWKFSSYLTETTTTAHLVILFNALWEVIAIYEARMIHLRAKHTVHAQFNLI
jgi:hypothetical protein